MKKIILLLCFAPLLLASTCENDNNQIYCTDQFVYGLTVNVLDSNNGNPLIEGVEVKAIDGDYQEILMSMPDIGNLFIGAGERAGNYTIIVTKDRYQTYTSNPIVLTRDVCHVIPQSLTINLQSN
jgi:hypothetical protein